MFALNFIVVAFCVVKINDTLLRGFLGVFKGIFY